MSKCKNCQWSYNGLCTCQGTKPCEVEPKYKITADEVVALVEKIEKVINPDGYFVGLAYNDNDGLAHLIIDKGDPNE